MEQDKAALQTNKKTAKRRKWLILLCVLAVFLLWKAYDLWFSPYDPTLYRFIRIFNAGDTLGGLHIPTSPDKWEFTEMEDLDCLKVRFEGSAVHHALFYCDPQTQKVQYIAIWEFVTERDLTSVLPTMAVYLNHIVYPLQFYKNQTVYDELSSFCAGDIDTIGYTEPSPNHICYALVTQDSEEDPKMFLRTFVFELPHDGERKSFSYFYPAYQKIAE